MRMVESMQLLARIVEFLLKDRSMTPIALHWLVKRVFPRAYELPAFVLNSGKKYQTETLLSRQPTATC